MTESLTVNTLSNMLKAENIERRIISRLKVWSRWNQLPEILRCVYWDLLPPRCSPAVSGWLQPQYRVVEPQQRWPLSRLSVSCWAAAHVDLLLVCLCSFLQPAPWSGPPCLCCPPPLSSSRGARPRWPACWAATLLREPRWRGRWTVRRWRRASWAARRRRRADATAAAAPWAWARSAGWEERCTPARCSTMTTARWSSSSGASVRARRPDGWWGAGGDGGAGGRGLLLSSLWLWLSAAQSHTDQTCCRVRQSHVQLSG